MKQNFVPVFLACAFAAATAQADNNSIIVLQEAEAGAAVGNTLRVDQSGATNSLVAGAGLAAGTNLATLSPSNLLDGSEVLVGTVEGGLLQRLPLAPATQQGTGNSATIDVLGDGSFVGLSQTGSGNAGTLTANGGTALLFQNGTGNQGTIDVTGGALGSLVQEGNRNTGTVEVVGEGGEGLLAQLGDDNVTVLTIETMANASPQVSLTVQGNGLTQTVPANVFTSSGGQISIVQSQTGR